MRQLEKDFKREDIAFNGEETIHQPEINKLAEKVAMSILDENETGDESKVRGCALALSRDSLFACSRTICGSHAIGAVEALFKNDDLVKLVADQERRCPSCFAHVPRDAEVCPKCGTQLEKATITVQILRSKEKAKALAQLDTATGQIDMIGYEDESLGIGVAQSRIPLSDSSQSEMVHMVVQTKAIDKSGWIRDDDFENCMICGLSFSIFLRRRHHCRMCGKIVCQMCSQQRLTFSGEDAPQRVCWVCYTTHVITSLKKLPKDEEEDQQDADTDTLSRDGSQENVLDGRADSGAPSPSSTSPSKKRSGYVQDKVDGSSTASFSQKEDEGYDQGVDLDDLPAISVTMVQNFKMCSEPDLDTLFFLHCRYFRVIRWDGCVDSGRVFISIKRP
jgi:hypothetical protein